MRAACFHHFGDAVHVDGAGGVRLVDGTRPSVITGVDDYSRFCVSAKVVARATARPVCDALAEAMRSHGVPEAILTKPGPPTPEEWEEIRRHPEYGRDILSRCTPRCPDEVIRVAAEHHERLNGSGYPDRLTGDQICIRTSVRAVLRIS